MSDIVGIVATAIYEKADGISASASVELARAAIQAYEAAKREEAHTVCGDVDKAVTEASAAIPDLMKGLNPFDEERKLQKHRDTLQSACNEAYLGITGTTSVKDTLKGWKP